MFGAAQKAHVGVKTDILHIYAEVIQSPSTLEC